MLFPAAIGVPVHEASHLLVALAFAPLGHRVKKVSFFKPNQSGGLGFVSYQYRPTLLSSLANMLIGLAPIAGGVLAFLFVSFALVPQLYNYLMASSLDITGSGVASYLIDTYQFIVGMEWGFKAWIWLLVSGCIIAFMTPSKLDFHGCAKGFVLIYFALLLLTLVSPGHAQWLYEFALSGIALISPFLIATIATLSILTALATIKVFVYRWRKSKALASDKTSRP